MANLNQSTVALDAISEYVNALAQGSRDAMQALQAPDYQLDFVYGDAFDSTPLSATEAAEFWPAWLAGFPDRDYEITRTIVSQTAVVTEWTFTGTHSAIIAPPIFEQPIEATGRTVQVRGLSIYDLNQVGEITRETIYMDLATVMVELGVAL